MSSSLESQLTEWRDLYGQWCSLESELRQAQVRQGPGSPAASELAHKVRVLKERCGVALNAVDAALASRRGTHAGSAGASPSTSDGSPGRERHRAR